MATTTAPDLQQFLPGECLELRALAAEDFAELYGVASDPLIWEQHPAHDRWQEPVFRAFFDEAMATRSAYVILDTWNGRIIGSSRYHGYDPEKREIEIGWTFLARNYWGGRHNRELKRAMCEHAFRFVDRILFRVGPENLRSRRAVEKIGGVFVGETVDANGRPGVVYALTPATYKLRR